MASKVGIKLKLSVDELYNHKFNNVPRGYDPLDVDKYLDAIIKDYELIENEGVVSKSEYDEVLNQIEKLKQDNSNLLLQLESAKAKLPKTKSGNVNTDNLQLLERINVYEKYIYKLGVDPKKLK